MSMLSHLHRFRRDTSGAVAIEFALIGPILFALLFGIICMGYFIGVSHSVSQLATGAARISVAGLDMQERRELAQAYLDQASVNFPLLVQSALTPVIETQAPGTPAMTVTVTYALDVTVLGLANSLLGLDRRTITGSAYLAY